MIGSSGFWARFRANKAAVSSGWLVLAFAAACFLGPLAIRAGWGYDFEAQDLALGARPPEPAHWFGTDYHGRDLLTRVLYGGQISLLVGVLAALVAAAIGTVYGAIAAYAGGRVDAFMMRAVDVLYALPYMFLVIVFVAILGRSLVLLFVALGLVGWLTTARIVRGQVLSLAARDFVAAARAAGSSSGAIVFRHLIPNALGTVVVYFSLTVPAMILQEAFLSFLGLGVQAPRPSLGALINEGAAHVAVFWWELVFPGGAMAALLLALNFVGDGIRDALDPRSGAA